MVAFGGIARVLFAKRNEKQGAKMLGLEISVLTLRRRGWGHFFDASPHQKKFGCAQLNCSRLPVMATEHLHGLVASSALLAEAWTMPAVGMFNNLKAIKLAAVIAASALLGGEEAWAC